MSLDLETKEFPLLAIGQYACQIATEISNADRHSMLDKTSSFSQILCDEFRRLPSSLSTSDNAQRHTFPRMTEIGIFQTPVSWIEGFGDIHVKQELLDSIRCSLEQCCNPQIVGLISNAAGTLLPTIIEDINEEFPALSILSVLLVPMDGVAGMNNLNFILNTYFTLEHSEGCILRGPEDLKHLLFPPIGGNFYRKRINAANMYDMGYAILDRFLATDILFALRHHQWLLSHRSLDPLVDCRTSAWKNILKSRSKKSSKFMEDVDLVRACVTNLRSLYLHSEHHMNRCRLYDIRFSSSMMQLSFGGRIGCITSTQSKKIPLCSYKMGTAITPALKWATPLISWPHFVDVNYGDVLHTSNACVGYDLYEKHDKSQLGHSIYGIGFQSLFAKAYVSSMLTSAESILSRGAYLHRFDEISITCDDLSNALEALKTHCKG